MKNFSLYVAKTITASSTLFFTIFVARIAGIEYFGVFSLLLMITFIFNLIADWGFPIYGPAEINRLDDEEKKFSRLKAITRFRLLISIILSFAYLLLVGLFYREYFHLLIFGLPLILTSVLNVDWVCRAFNVPEVASTRQVLNAFLNITSVFLIWKFAMPVVWVFGSYTFSIIISNVIGIILLDRKVNFSYLRGISFNGTQEAVRHIFSGTKQVFVGLLFFNVVYALSIPFLTKFSTSYESSVFASYYSVFSSAVSVLLITQDIYMPKLSSALKEEFFNKYITILATACFMLIIVILLMPFYYHRLFPASFKIDNNLILAFSLLSYVYFLRLLFVNSTMITGQYKLFYISNLVGVISFLFLIGLVIVFNVLTALTAVLVLCLSESLVVFTAVLLQKTKLRMFFTHKMILLLIAIGSAISLQMFLPRQNLYIFTVVLMLCGVFFLIYSLKTLAENGKSTSAELYNK